MKVFEVFDQSENDKQHALEWWHDVDRSNDHDFGCFVL
jgi:hypothetical protein